ncbi:hypothetical protein LTR85_004962 [Meristemomyces frigidus]|nr:hypothetical protein LTR85_004962 [Meristemomyces frigidus]
MDDDEQLAQIQAEVDEWSTNSTECFAISLLRSDGSEIADRFHPEFTYPIFGEEEAIFGYQDLSIHLTFAAHDLRPHIDIKYGKKFKAQGDVRPTDIKEALADFLPEDAFEAPVSDSEAASFRPPGEKIHSYTSEGRYFEIWCASLADAQAREIVENMQILVPLFIEGGSTLQLEQDWTTQRWKLFLQYQTDVKVTEGSPYSLVGYGTSYRVFTLPDRHKPLQSDLDLFAQSLDSFLPSPDGDAMETSRASDLSTPLELSSRERLSQFLILPPYQGSGHGQELYNTMYTHLTRPTNVREFTVEDPNEAFDDLRDLCDLLSLRKHVPDFAALRINTGIPADKLAATSHIPTDLIIVGDVRESIMRQTKIMQRQFDRLVEMHTLSFIPPLNRSRNRITRKEKCSNEHDKAYYFWRLYAKQRLYIHNRDQLIQLERNERVEKLEAALDGVQEGYAKMLEKVEARESGLETNGNAAVEGASAPLKVRKRKVVSEDDDDDEKEEREENKRARVQ